MSVMILDIETETHPYVGSKSNPRHPLNYVVAQGWAVDHGPVQSKYYNSKAEAEGWLHIPDDVTVIVAHNAPFEIDWMLCTCYNEFLKFLARGGRVFCTAYAEYLLSNQQDTYPSLDETAPKYGGTHKVDGIKILWDQGVLTSAIDKDLLMEYLAGPGGDIENTRKIFLGQAAALQARGMWDMALLRMEGMLGTCFAMYNGLHIDRDVAFTQKAEQEQRLGVLYAELRGMRRNIPDYVGFKVTSDYHMSAWLFGGPIKYKIKDTWFDEDGFAKYEKADFYKFADGTLIEVTYFGDNTSNPVTDPDVITARKNECVCSYGPIEKYKSGKNKGQPKVLREDTKVVKQKIYERVFLCEPLVPLDILPAEVQKQFKEEFAQARKLSDDTPVFSTSKDAIDKLVVRNEYSAEVRKLLGSLVEYAAIDKDLGTYYLRDKLDAEGNVLKSSGMLQYLTEENVVYHILNCTSTVTTRLSATRPNMQNLPRADEDADGKAKSEVKKMFTSRFDDGVWLDWALACGRITSGLYAECIANIAAGIENGCIIEADYSALEVVTLAAFSKDTNLVKALLDKIDMHCMRLAQKLGEPYADVLRKCKDETHPEHASYKIQRIAIKPKAFAYQYGATAFGIAFATGCTVEEAQAFIDAEKALFPGVESYYEDVVFKGVESNCSLHRELAEGNEWRVYKRGVYQSPGSTCYEFRQFPKTIWHNNQRVRVMEFKPTQMRNYPIQGESGYFVQGITGRIIRWLIEQNFFGGKLLLINQVHDALYFDCHRSILKEVAVEIKRIMESIPELFSQYGYDLGVPFPVEVEAGSSMFHKERV